MKIILYQYLKCKFEMMCDVLSLRLGSLIEIVVLFTYIMCHFQENLSIAF